ncbi:MAG: CoB--CoM heterodisulfide reductase iron-sulfur subunit A family protein [Candidatus Aminicenantes bacterium]|nr:CoB--CoM heterodisulfide reductase iron-sulfur subunit A family protein [Candidatus Aminicenantes bacterium]MBL7083628.1 CoB--CoM heterodisulfide reductase iron-sulfur subunit A family protein [Candidatus Aminicenantes bacterium]
MKGSVLVVGAGPAGMRASSELLQQGFKVYLLEEKPTIGGKMAQIDKMFPTNECATCTALPRMLELTSNPNMAILAFAEVTSIEGSPGDFKVKILKKPRYVDPMKCTACTDCFPVCPVGGIPMEFNLGRGASKAISFYSPFPPRKALIYPEKCDYILKGKCGDKDKPPCVEACEPEAINFSQKPQETEINVGAIILSTGLDEVREDKLLGKYGYNKTPNVLTALEYERLLSGLGPTGGIVKCDDGKEPQSLAWLVLDDSSSIGFMTAAAEALGTIEKNPQVSVSILHKDISLTRDSYSDFYSQSKESGVQFIHTDSVTVDSEGTGELNISYEGKEKGNLKAEMLILVPPLAGSPSVRKLSEVIGINVDEHGFFERADGDSHPIHTSREGIFLCGGAEGPKGIDSSIIQACSAAANVAALLAPARGTEIAPPVEKDLKPVKAEDEPEIAVVICRCGMNIAGLLNIDELVEYTLSMPHVKQVEITPFGCDGVAVKQLLGTKKFNRIVLGACSPKTHEDLFSLHTELGGLNQHLLEIVNLRNQCTWVHSTDKAEATEKAKTLMRMGVSRTALLEPLEDINIQITPSCLVIGCTPCGISCALTLAKMGLEVYVIESENDPGKIKENQDPLVKSLLDDLKGNEKAKIYMGAKIGAVEGFIGNYKAEIVKKDGKEDIDIGSILIATGKKMGVSSNENETDYEADLALTRDEKDYFTGMLGILNPLDFNTEGVFMCGSARTKIDALESVIDGEAAASRIAGIISKEQRLKSPRISFVVDESCDGCAYCIEPCPAHAITLIEYMYEDNIKKTVQVNEAVCRGCGICMATCPKKGIYVRHFKPEQFTAMIKSIQEGA